MGLACNLTAIPAAKRPRYTELVARLRSAITNRTELPDGYTYQLDMPLTDLAEWIATERLCCPFLNSHLNVSADTQPTLTLRGRKAPNPSSIAPSPYLKYRPKNSIIRWWVPLSETT
jgi:hypothetical protein